MDARHRIATMLSCLALAACATRQPAVELAPAEERSAHSLAAQQEQYTSDVYPFFEEYCFSCHGIRKKEAGIDLKAAKMVTELGQDESTWRRVLTMLETGQMPPADERQPSARDRDEIAAFIDTELDASIRAMRPDPGRVTARRLNRQEYEYTILDLLGVQTKVARSFPVDDSGYGFDNIGDALSLSPLLMEKYLSAAEEIVSAALARDLALPADAERGARRLIRCGHESEGHRPGCASANLRELASRAYRRPATRNEVRELVSLVRLVEGDGGSFEQGLQLAVETVLVSPKFLFRLERDTVPGDSQSVRVLNDFELASRLSYFLWSSMPDERLFELAAAGRLHEPETRVVEVKRMIEDEKSQRFVENFAGQWLHLRNLEQVSVDRELYPEFDRELRTAMQEESELYFQTVLREDRSVLEFVKSDFTFVNERLAKHYGIPGVTGPELRRVAVDGSQRGGVLTQASVLTLTSRPTRTSPVLRGAWVMENILGRTPPPPPDAVPPLEEDPKKIKGTVREQLEAHRSQPSCAACHARIDPLGFGLESYDPIGRWRTEERGEPVNSGGVLPTGQRFENSAEFRSLLLEEPDEFVRCFTEKVLTYALGRGVEAYDRPAVASIMERAGERDFRFQALIQEIVESVPFRMRRSAGERELELSAR